jgi:hypothetical protein
LLRSIGPPVSGFFCKGASVCGNSSFATALLAFLVNPDSSARRVWHNRIAGPHALGTVGKPQSVACRLEDPDYGKVTIQTLLEVANVFDVALRVRFVPYSTFVRNTRDVSSASMQVPEFKDDLGFRAHHSANIRVFLPSSEDGSFETGWLDQSGSENTISVLPGVTPGAGGVHVFN